MELQNMNVCLIEMNNIIFYIFLVVMLSTELNEKVESKQLTQNSIVIVDKYTIKTQGDK